MRKAEMVMKACSAVYEILIIVLILVYLCTVNVNTNIPVVEVQEQPAVTESEPIAAVKEDPELVCMETETELAPEYDYEKVMRVVTQEAGDDIDLCLATCQCIMNACNATGLNPEEVIDTWGYTFPADWISEASATACSQILCSGETYEPVGKANVFYSTWGGFYSEWHETQEYITTLNGVRFFYMEV